MGACFSDRLQFADGALQDGDLCHGIAGGFQLGADLVLEVRGIADAVDEEIEEALGGQQALGPEFFDGVVADRNVGASDVEHHVVVTTLADAFEA